MRVTPVASTMLLVGTKEDGELWDDYSLKASGYTFHPFDWEDRGSWVEHPDELAEAAGRLCYLSFGRPNLDTATNSSYLANIIHQQHFSVLEHASVTFYVEGVSRSLLTELERHRHLSFSVVSQRYVDESEAEFVVPPALEGSPGLEVLATEWHEEALKIYEHLYDRLIEKGFSKKQAREAARSVLPNATETRFFVTGNLRTWREILQKRLSPGADAEIQLLAQKILDHLKRLAPNSMQDFA